MSSILFPFLLLKSLGQLIVFRGVFRMKQKPKEKYRTTLPRTVWPICLDRIWGDDPLQVTPILQRLKGLWGEFPIWFNAMNPELCSLLLPEELTNFIRSLPFRQSNFFSQGTIFIHLNEASSVFKNKFLHCFFLFVACMIMQYLGNKEEN